MQNLKIFTSLFYIEFLLMFPKDVKCFEVSFFITNHVMLISTVYIQLKNLKHRQKYFKTLSE
jgi:hypothetical protein